MRIGSIHNSPTFGMKIVQNENLKDLISDLQVRRGYSQKKIEGIMDKIKKMADDSYEFEVVRVNGAGEMWYNISNNDEDVAVDERGDYCSTSKFFMLHNIKKLCKNMIKVNKKAGSAKEIFNYAGK